MGLSLKLKDIDDVLSDMKDFKQSEFVTLPFQFGPEEFEKLDGEGKAIVLCSKPDI